MRIARILVTLVTAFSLTAGEAPDPKVLTLNENAKPAAARIEDLAWIEGHWRGTGLGAVAEEVWSAPEAGAMMGMFRLIRDGKLSFYEILTLSQEGESVLLRIKHFNPDLTGWEEKDRSVEFRLVRLDPRHAWFDGLTFERSDDDTLRVTVRVSDRKKGTSRDEEFVYTRR
jgi:hypothetical protein